MCLALPAKILERTGDDGWVRLGDAKMKVNLVMTENAQVDDWVLVHAGFAIEQVTEDDALETWQIIDDMQSDAPPLAEETSS
jgi:hydrogenase expression/formation protein HypC